MNIPLQTSKSTFNSNEMNQKKQTNSKTKCLIQQWHSNSTFKIQNANFQLRTQMSTSNFQCQTSKPRLPTSNCELQPSTFKVKLQLQTNVNQTPFFLFLNSQMKCFFNSLSPFDCLFPIYLSFCQMWLRRNGWEMTRERVSIPMGPTDGGNPRDRSITWRLQRSSRQGRRHGLSDVIEPPVGKEQCHFHGGSPPIPQHHFPSRRSASDCDPE